MSNIKDDKRMQRINDSIATWPLLERLSFVKKFQSASLKCYDILCTDCKLKLHRLGDGGFKRCSLCQDKCTAIMQPVLDELNNNKNEELL